MKKVKICDRTLNNGLHKFEPDGAAAIITALNNSSIHWHEQGNVIVPVEAIRATEIEDIEFCTGKGGKVIFEPRDLLRRTDFGVLKLFEEISPFDLFGFTIADDGTMRSNDVERLTLYAAKHLSEKTSIGFRPNDGSGRAFTLACTFINTADYLRDYFIETSLFGIGELGGYLPTELLAEHFNGFECEDVFEVEHLVYTIRKHIAPLKGPPRWGISPETFTFSHNRTVCGVD
ncbi:MAG: hypothetical protein LBH43_08920 [Treponema sp.]|jgi:hypothetical protein|nr:hypothetical protein [Treponema sp.]